jgi:hypothetical protein
MEPGLANLQFLQGIAPSNGELMYTPDGLGHRWRTVVAPGPNRSPFNLAGLRGVRLTGQKGTRFVSSSGELFQWLYQIADSSSRFNL